MYNPIPFCYTITNNGLLLLLPLNLSTGQSEDHLCTDIMSAFESCEKNRGRLNSPLSCSNGKNRILPEFETFQVATPRVPMPSGSVLV